MKIEIGRLFDLIRLITSLKLTQLPRLLFNGWLSNSRVRALALAVEQVSCLDMLSSSVYERIFNSPRGY